MKIKMLAMLLSCALVAACGAPLTAAAQNAPAQSVEAVELDHVGATSCWWGTCGHKSTTYSYGSYSVANRYTNYYYTGYYLDPGVTQTVSASATVTQSVNVTAGVDAGYAKASVGYTGSTSVSMSVSQSIKNETNTRKYAHIGVEMESRYNTLTKNTRTYYPAMHITATDKYCQYSTSKSTPSCTVATGRGLSLRANR